MMRDHDDPRPIPNRLTLGDIEGAVKSAYYHNPPGTTLTLCVLTLKNGYTVVGKSACVDPKEFRHDIGEQIAWQNAINEIWQLEGYLLQQRRFEAGL